MLEERNMRDLEICERGFLERLEVKGEYGEGRENK